MLIDDLQSHTFTTSNGCKEWTRAKTSDGYGVVRVGATNKFVHRLVAEQKFGNISGKVVRHSCHNPSCCNADHLMLGSHQDNMNDMVAADRQAKGERNGYAKLTEKEVKQIKERFKSAVKGIRSNAKQLAMEFNVSSSTIRSIINGSRWSYLKEKA